MTDKEYITYLEALIPERVNINRDYLPQFKKEARYMGNRWYEWDNMGSSNTRELILKGVLQREGIRFKEN